MTFEEVWAQLEADDPTGAYKQAREMAELAVEQLEYAYNNGYAEAKKEFERPQGEWVFNQYDANPNIGNYHCSLCHYIPVGNIGVQRTNFCPYCGAKMVLMSASSEGDLDGQ